MPLKILPILCCCLVKLTMCETDILAAVADAHIPSGTISVIESRDHRRWTLNQTRTTPKLDNLISKQKWLFETSGSETERIPPAEQRKQHPHQAIIIFLNDITSIYHIIDFIRSKRIVGPETKMIITAHGITESIIKKLLTLVWNSLKIFHSCFIHSNRLYEMVSQELEQKAVGMVFQQSLLVKELNMRALWYEDGIYVFYENYTQNGVCIQMVKTMASALDITVKTDFLLTEGNSYRPFGPNGDFGGFLGVLHRQEADIVCGSISLFESRHHAFDALPSFTQEPLRWVVATNGPIRGWKRLIYEFSNEVWMYVGVTWITSLLILYAHFLIYKKPNQDFAKIAVHIVGATLEISFNKHLGGFRRFLWLFLVYSMIITSAYKSGLTSLLTLPIMEEEISTVEEGLNENRLIFILPSWKDVIESWTDSSDATTLWDVDLRGRYEIVSSSLESLQRMGHNQSVMTLMPEDEAESLIFRYFFDKDGLKAFYYLPGRFMNYPKVVCMAPGHPLLNKFAAKQLEIVEAGLIDFWFKLLFHRQLVSAISSSGNDIFEAKGPLPLGLVHLSYVFWGFLFGMVLSFFMFCGEVLVRFSHQ